MRFFLGTHEPAWLSRLNVPLFVSIRRITRRKSLPAPAATPWALDSGGFTQLDQPPHGWTMPADTYASLVSEIGEGVGMLEWAAPQDWMCEPWIVAKTGLSVREHQERTVQNFLDLRGRGPFIPVLQGWELDDYLRCLELYAEAGVDLAAEPVVGLGSVCRRQATDEIGDLVTELAGYGLRLHGFGVKKAGVAQYGDHLASSDSMSWSVRARNSAPLPGCTHKTCANCSRFALRWRAELLSRINPN